MRIMRNAFIDDVRKSGRTVAVDAEELARAPDLAAADGALRAEALAVDQAMKRLPADQRMAVALVLVEGYSYAEAAQALELPPGTLASRVARGREALIADLEGAAA